MEELHFPKTTLISQPLREKGLNPVNMSAHKDFTQPYLCQEVLSGFIASILKVVLKPASEFLSWNTLLDPNQPDFKGAIPLKQLCLSEDRQNL